MIWDDKFNRCKSNENIKIVIDKNEDIIGFSE